MAREPKIGMTYATEGDVLLALRDHFTPGEYVVLPQVRNGAGFSANRTADALVMSVWPSRGLHLHGIEIKVSRADWWKEKQNPKKADDIAKYCDYWWLAVGDENIVKDGELPPTWGLLIPGKEAPKMRVKIAPTKLEAQPVSRSFLAAILKKALEVVVPLQHVDAEIERRVAERVAVKEEQLKDSLTREFDPERLMSRNKKLEAAAEAFHEVTGVWMDAGDAERYRKMGKALCLLRYSGLADWVEKAEDSLKRTIKDLSDLRKALPESAEPEPEQLKL